MLFLTPKLIRCKMIPTVTLTLIPNLDPDPEHESEPTILTLLLNQNDIFNRIPQPNIYQTVVEDFAVCVNGTSYKA